MSNRKPDRMEQLPATERTRLDKAMREGRFQSALELAKQVYKGEPNPENRQRLVQCYLGRARQLREQGSFQDAAGVLNAGVEHVGGDPATIVRFAEELALCGDISRGLNLIEWLPEPRPANRVFVFAADSALQRGAAGRELLSDMMRTDFDRVRKAFQLLTSSEDAAAKEAIQGIGLTSPFLEWKLLLRGLLAYYERDDERAIDNWSRLDSTRLPARLAAPFRFQCDQAFASAQTPAMQLSLRRQFDRLAPEPALLLLRGLQRRAHETSGEIDLILREVKSFLPQLKAQRPDVVERLGCCLYWDILENGLPEDLKHLERMFGRPADDPGFNRVHAMRLERGGQFAFANAEWYKFEKVVAESRRLADVERTRARAMIWLRMGRNAERQEDLIQLTERFSSSAPFGAEPPNLSKPEPSAESCFRHAIELAPDWLDPHVALFDRLKKLPRRNRSDAAAHQLLTRFPDHLPTLEALANAYETDRDLDRAAEMLDRALSLNPLQRTFRHRLAAVRRRMGARYAARNEFDAGREAFQAAVDLLPNEPHGITDASRAALEFKAGNLDRAEDLLRQAASLPEIRMLLDGWMYGQAMALDLPKALKKRFEQPFKKLLDSSHPTVEEAFAMVRLFWLWNLEQFSYHGAKSHLKKALALANWTQVLPYRESIIDPLGQFILDLKANAILRRLSDSWARQYPQNPWPAYFEMESYLAQNQEQWQLWRLKPLAKKARRLAENLPPSSSREQLLANLDRREQQFKALNPFSAIFEQFRAGFSEFGDDFDDLEDFGP